MKKITIGLMVLVGTMAGTACKKSKSSTPDPVYPAGIHAKINGVTWNAGYVNKLTSSGGGSYSFEFDGPDSITHESLLIEVPLFTSRGIHTITATSSDKASYSVDTSMAAPILATSGQINITALNDTAVGGTFNFVAGGKTITNGTFYVNF